MLFQRLTTSNTFSQWVAEKQKIVGFVNELTDGYGSTYANTNLSVGEDLHVNGNVLVTGTFILDEIDFDDLTVAGNLNVNEAISAANGEFLNLNVVNNVATFNVTTDVAVGEDASVYGELDVVILNTSNIEVLGTATFDGTNVTVENVIVSENIQTVNTTSSLQVGTEGLIYGILTVDGELSTTDLKTEFTTFNEVEVTNNVYISGEVSLGNVISVQDIAATGDITTGNLEVDLVTIQSLQVTQNVSLLNTTNELYVGTNATIYGNLNVSGNTGLTNVTVDYANIETANVYSLVGSANTQIYDTIDATTAATTVASNIGAFTAYVLALG